MNKHLDSAFAPWQGVILIVRDIAGQEIKMPMPMHERKVCQNTLALSMMKKKKRRK